MTPKRNRKVVARLSVTEKGGTSYDVGVLLDSDALNTVVNLMMDAKMDCAEFLHGLITIVARPTLSPEQA